MSDYSPRQDVLTVAEKLYVWSQEYQPGVPVDFEDANQQPWIDKARELLLTNTGTGAVSVHLAARPYADKVIAAIEEEFDDLTLSRIRSFSALHDICDANEFLIDHGPPLEAGEGGSLFEDLSEANLGLINAVTDIVDEYLRTRKPADLRPYSVCVHCGSVIRFNADKAGPDDTPGVWWNEDFDRVPNGEWGLCPDYPSTVDGPHEPRWLTLGEFRTKTAHLPDSFPITADGQSPTSGVQQDWFNLRLVEVPTLADLAKDQPASLLLDLQDDFDTRQW